MQGGLNPKYVLDEMEQYEINPLVTNIYKREKESWEQTRMLGYIIAQSNSTKKLKATDIINFPWDDDYKPTNTTVVSNEDKERLRQQAEILKNKLYGK